MNIKFIDDSLIGDSPQIRKIKNDIISISRSKLPVLIYGETGTGKEIIARLIHKLSDRSENTYIVLNIAAIPDNLVLSELLGYEKGAFSSAVKRKIGLFERANNGTLFLDEIGDASKEVQKILISIIDRGIIKPLGSFSEIILNTRIISATNKFPLDQNFSNDLLLRLSPFKIFIPPLRERSGDIPLLVNFFIEQFNLRDSKKIKITKKALKILSTYEYPGNIRELRNILEIIFNTIKGNEITSEDLKYILTKNNIVRETDDILKLKEELESTQKELNFFKKTTIIANPIWQGRGFIKENDYCFVLMPFADQNDIQIVLMIT
jgi:transcriptional regulator with PAS, ATPase and Fis domain